MKIKKGFAKREIAGSNIVVPVGKTSLDFNGMITLNDTASFIWDCFGEDITVAEAVKKVVVEYDIDEATA
ncbi:MAG: PqqD family protein, partial [Clostridiales bacterium]|nr:PqqD family protein [Clostridiales bacterium]